MTFVKRWFVRARHRFEYEYAKEDGTLVEDAARMDMYATEEEAESVAVLVAARNPLYFGHIFVAHI